jgi:glycosyltransferase involved in cell wall biosynthesis
MMSESTAWDEPRVLWKEWIKGRLVKRCAAGLVGGTPHADYLARLGMPRDRIFLGYDIVDNDYFSAKAAEVRGQEEEFRKRLGLPGKYFLASARFIEKKNLPRLMEAYARYRQLAQPNAPSALKLDATSRCLRGSASPREPAASSESWDLVLLGDGPLRESLNQQLSNLNLAQHVHLPGFKQYDELPAYFGLAGAFVHASATEQWGLVVNEAMASGLPVLVSRRCGCATDLVREGGNGFTFEHDNVEAIANLMLKISTPGFPLADFGAESRRIISSWGPERFAGGLCEAVTVALKKPPVRTGRIDRLLLRLVAKR